MAVKENTRTNRSGQDEVTFVIKEHIGVISTNNSGWTREVNVVSWNDRPSRLDIRDWNPEHDKMSRGIGLNAVEVAKLREILLEVDLPSLDI